MVMLLQERRKQMVDYIDIISGLYIISFIITIILGPITIPLLKRLNIGQNVRMMGL